MTEPTIKPAPAGTSKLSGWRISTYVLATLLVVAVIVPFVAQRSSAPFNLQTLLAVWAVLGPLIAAALSALWQRSTQLTDRAYHAGVTETERTHAEGQATITYKRAREQTAADAMRAQTELDRSNLLEVVSRLLQTTMVFIDARSDSMTPGLASDATRTRAMKAYEEMTTAYNQAVLLGDADFADACTAVWNITFKMPINYEITTQTTYDEVCVSNRNARAALILKARVKATALRSEANRYHGTGSEVLA